MIDKEFIKEVAIEHAQGICEYFGVKYVAELENKLSWKQKIVKEALDLEIISDPLWIEKAEEKADIWFVLSIALNIYKKLKK